MAIISVNVGQRNIPDTAATAKCYAVDAALDLATHTLKNCKNENNFSPEYKEFITDPLVAAARNAYVWAYTANKIRVTDAKSWHDREELQLQAIQSVSMLPALINLARRLNHLRRGKTEYWIRVTIETRDLLKKWHTADKKRYKDKYKLQ